MSEGSTEVSFFPATWDHEMFFVLAVLSSILGTLSSWLCSLVLVRGPRHVILSQLLTSLVRADAISCLPLFIRCLALAWQDWPFGELVCRTTNYVYETMEAVRCVFIVLLLCWHISGLRGSPSQCDNVTFLAWFLPMASGLVVLLDSHVQGRPGKHVCSPFSVAHALLHHTWYMSTVAAPTCLMLALVPVTVACSAVRRRSTSISDTRTSAVAATPCLQLAVERVASDCGGGIRRTETQAREEAEIRRAETQAREEAEIRRTETQAREEAGRESRMDRSASSTNRPPNLSHHQRSTLRPRTEAMELVCMLAIIQVVCTMGSIVLVWLKKVHQLRVYQTVLVPVFATLSIMVPMLNFPMCYALMPDFKQAVGKIFVTRT